MANMVLICEHHHRLVHEGGWRLHTDKTGGWSALAPGGRVQRAAPRLIGDLTVLPATHDASIDSGTLAREIKGDPLHLDYAVAAFA